MKPSGLLRLAISLAVFASGCEVAFEPDVAPVDWGPGGAPQGPDSLDSPQGLDPTTLNIPETGSQEELEYWSELLGFGRDGRPDIDDYFNPYLRVDPFTGEIYTGPTGSLLAAKEELYGIDRRLYRLAQESPDNPLNFQAEEPMAQLSSDARRAIAFVMVSSYNKHHLGLFLKRIGAAPSLYWNYEPAWLAAQMELHPNELRAAQFELLQMYAENPEFWEWLQDTKPVGPPTE